MKTTVKVSISGTAFTIDDDAFNVLNHYLNTLKRHFNKKPEGNEVVDDIEARLAELLSMRINSPEQVINIDDANEVIKIMGAPSDFINDEYESPATEGESYKPAQSVSIRKRLYRDIDNKIIAGVCSGLGNYLNTDPVIIRLIFAGFALFLFTAFISYPWFPIVIAVYIIFWIVMPAANTPQRKLEMEGKNPTIDEIEQKVQDEQQKASYGKTKTSWGIANIFAGIIRVFILFIAGIILFSAVLAIIAVIGSMLGFTYHTGIGIKDITEIIGINTPLIAIILSFVVLYPLAMLVYWGAKALFRFKLRDKMVMIVAFCIWIISLIGLASYGVTFAWTEAGSRHTKMEVFETINISTQYDTLYVNMPYDYQQSSDEAIGELRANKSESPRIWIAEYDGIKTLFFVPEIKVRYSNDVNNFQLHFRKRAFGRNKRNAQQIADNTCIEYTQTDSLLLINPLMFNKNNPIRNTRQIFDIIIYAPHNKKIIIQEPLLSKNTQNEDNNWAFTFSSGIKFGDD